jgi:hypothetical protein
MVCQDANELQVSWLHNKSEFPHILLHQPRMLHVRACIYVIFAILLHYLVIADYVLIALHELLT